MTYDPHGRDRPDFLRDRDDSVSGAFVGGVALALLLVFGVTIFVLGSGHRDIAATDSPRLERTIPELSTTGQGGSQFTPGRDQTRPSPAPPASSR